MLMVHQLEDLFPQSRGAAASGAPELSPVNSDTLLPSAGRVSNILFVIGMSKLAMIFYFSVLITFSVCGEYFYTCKFVIIGKMLG